MYHKNRFHDFVDSSVIGSFTSALCCVSSSIYNLLVFSEMHKTTVYAPLQCNNSSTVSAKPAVYFRLFLLSSVMSCSRDRSLRDRARDLVKTSRPRSRLYQKLRDRDWRPEMNGLSYFAIQIQTGIFKLQSKSNQSLKFCKNLKL